MRQTHTRNTQNNTYISSRVSMLFSCGWVVLKRSWMMWPTNDWQIPVFLEISSTDWWVCDAPSWLNMRSLSRSNYLQ